MTDKRRLEKMITTEDMEGIRSYCQKHDVKRLAGMWEGLIERHSYCRPATAMHYGSTLIESYLRGHGVRLGGPRADMKIALAGVLLCSITRFIHSQPELARGIWYPHFNRLLGSEKAVESAIKQAEEEAI